MPDSTSLTDPSEPELSRLLEALPDPHLVLSSDAKLLGSNKVLSNQLNITIEHLVTRLTEPDTLADLAAGEPVVLQFQSADGETHACEVLARAFGPKALMVRYRALTHCDEQELRNVHARLALREADLASAIQGGVWGIWRYEPVSNSYIVRGEILKWMQKDPLLDTATNADWAPLLSLEDRLAAQEAMKEGLRTGRPGQCNLKLMTPEGDKWVRAQGQTARFTPDGQPAALAGVLMDISQERAIEEKLKAYTQALERSHRELNRFSTMASHDLQEPLRKISAFASLLRRRYEGELDTDADHSLDFLVDAAGRMRSLIDDLLLYSNISTCTLTLSPVSLQELFEDTLEVFKKEIQTTQAEILTDPLPTITGDGILLKHLFEHLVSNALKFRTHTHAHIRLRVKLTDSFWQFELIDDGIGFDPKFADKIFTPFGRLHHRDAYGGNGVGLAICQQAVERHGGTIKAESAEGEGAKFTFTLPLEPPSSFLTGLSGQTDEDRPCG